ncbi:site-specific integrase [Gordonia alkanivorans]|uniref:site-specific integrase n=1 Tax=Gordonia alkanivorans TaxID=84096 RepID=UPI002449A4C4|nr:site-specific integrase [Gordonia alkanivorans]MDH3045043.1 site-specific integrase [Gordonia alkanivorans]
MSRPARQQRPPQIKIRTVRNRSTGKDETRYELVLDVGIDPDTGKRKQIRRRFRTEKDAKDALAELSTEVAQGTYAPAAKGFTVAQAIDEWLAHKGMRLKPTTLRSYRVTLQPVRDELGDKTLRELTEAHLVSLIQRLRAGEVRRRDEDGSLTEGFRPKWSGRSCNYLISITRQMLRSQQRQRRVSHNAAEFLESVEQTDSKAGAILSEANFYRILDHEDRDRHLWWLALHGLRRGEIAGLRWDKVNFESGILTVSENRVVVGDQISSGTPKSKASQRHLPMSDDLMDVLRAARASQRAERLALGQDYGSGEYVASDATGDPYHPNLLTFRWGKLLDTLGIPRVRLHDARHSSVSLLIARGVDIPTVAAWHGHQNPAVTMARYAHSQPEALRSAAAVYRRAE